MKVMPLPWSHNVCDCVLRHHWRDMHKLFMGSTHLLVKKSTNTARKKTTSCLCVYDVSVVVFFHYFTNESSSNLVWVFVGQSINASISWQLIWSPNKGNDWGSPVLTILFVSSFFGHCCFKSGSSFIVWASRNNYSLWLVSSQWSQPFCVKNNLPNSADAL